METLSNLRPETVESFLGIKGYVTRAKGIGGVIKLRPEDFLTWELLTSGVDARSAYDAWRGGLKGLGGHVLAVMRKQRIDTIRACTLIARSLGIKPGLIGVCGIKDKMSISWQFITVPSGSMPSQGLRISELIQVLPIAYARRRLTSKMLARNIFEITIRGSSGDLEEVEKCIEELRSVGLPNFYGHQRFGITRPITAVVGRLMIENRLEEAVKVFLTERSPLESLENGKAREMLLEDFDPSRALEYFPRGLRYERAILKHLTSNPGDYLGALRSLPLRLRRLMVESVSALIFNKTLSRIISENLIRDVEPGDLAVRIDRFGRPEPGRPIKVSRGNLKQVEMLVDRGRLAIALPSPGFSTPIPRSRKGEILSKVMSELKIDPAMFRLKVCPEASTRGVLRPVIVPRWSCKAFKLDESSIKLFIELPPGSYATILLREIMKPNTPLAFLGKTINNEEGLEGSS